MVLFCVIQKLPFIFLLFEGQNTQTLKDSMQQLPVSHNAKPENRKNREPL